MGKNAEYLDIAMLAGEILLENGAEVSRVHVTISHVLESFGITDYNIYVLSNGIFATVEETGENPAHSIRYATLGSINFERIMQVNDISRHISEKKGDVDLAEIRSQLQTCSVKPPNPMWQTFIAMAVGCFGFCIIMGGSFIDGFAALLCGLGLQLFMILSQRLKLNKFIKTILGALWVSIIAAAFFRLGLGHSLDMVITGAIIPLVPGVALTTAIRDFFDENYVSGVINLIDALLKAASIAIGVVVALSLDSFV